VKLENYFESLLRVFQDHTNTTDEDEIRELKNTMESLEGVDRHLKLSLFTEKVKDTKSALESRHTLPILK
jgi:hypothetical protein